MKREDWFKSKKFKRTRTENGKKGNLRIHELAQEREREYLKNPKLCKVCQNPLPYKYHNGKQFCNTSCAAKFNNKNRIFEPTKDKRVKILNCFMCGTEITVNIRVSRIKAYCENCKEINKKNKKERKKEKKYSHICLCCDKSFISAHKNTKYCSSFCSGKHMMEIGKIKSWQSRNIKSYPERFFEKVLNNNNLSYEINKPLRCEDRNYFLDFYFADKNIDLEIDGKQHYMPERIVSDINRDTVLTEKGIKVFRIKWKSINTEDGKNEIRKNIQNFLDFYKNA